MTTSLSRRNVLAATAALAAAGSVAAPAFASSKTPIAALWAKAEAARLSLRAHAAELSAVEALGGGLPGWMRASAAANAIGHQRYEALKAMLAAIPVNGDDLALMHQAARQPEMAHGPRSWALTRLETAERMLAA